MSVRAGGFESLLSGDAFFKKDSFHDDFRIDEDLCLDDVIAIINRESTRSCLTDSDSSPMEGLKQEVEEGLEGWEASEGLLLHRAPLPSSDMPTPIPGTSGAPLPRNICPQWCAVCNDAASGYHYEAPSCNGCKTFFRRTILSQRKFICKNGNKCLLGKSARVICRACRYNRCVEVGMNPLGLLVSDLNSRSLAIQLGITPEKNVLVRDIMRKRKVELCEPSTSKGDNEDEQPETKLAVQRLLVQQNTFESRIDSLIYLELKADYLRKSTFKYDLCKADSLEALLRTHSAIGAADKYEPMPGWPLKIEPQEYNLEEKIQLGIPIQKRMDRPPNQKNWFFFDLYMSIEYAKTFMFFQKLSVADQKALIKNVGLLCLIVTQAYYSFENKSDSIIWPDGRLALRLSKRPSKRQQELCTQAIEPLVRLKLDKREYVLLKAIVLCQAATEGLTLEGRELVEAERNIYAQALFEYSCSQRGAQGPSHFASTIAAIDAFVHVAKKQRDYHTFFKVFIPNREPKKVIDELLD